MILWFCLWFSDAFLTWNLSRKSLPVEILVLKGIFTESLILQTPSQSCKTHNQSKIHGIQNIQNESKLRRKHQAYQDTFPAYHRKFLLWQTNSCSCTLDCDVFHRPPCSVYAVETQQAQLGQLISPVSSQLQTAGGGVGDIVLLWVGGEMEPVTFRPPSQAALLFGFSFRGTLNSISLNLCLAL